MIAGRCQSRRRQRLRRFLVPVHHGRNRHVTATVMFQCHLRRAAVAQPEKFHTRGGLASIHVFRCIRQARRYAGFDAKQSSLMEISKRSRAQRISALRQHENLFAAGTSNIGTWLVERRCVPTVRCSHSTAGWRKTRRAKIGAARLILQMLRAGEHLG